MVAHRLYIYTCTVDMYRVYSVYVQYLTFNQYHTFIVYHTHSTHSTQEPRTPNPKPHTTQKREYLSIDFTY